MECNHCLKICEDCWCNLFIEKFYGVPPDIVRGEIFKGRPTLSLDMSLFDYCQPRKPWET